MAIKTLLFDKDRAGDVELFDLAVLAKAPHFRQLRVGAELFDDRFILGLGVSAGPFMRRNGLRFEKRETVSA